MMLQTSHVPAVVAHRDPATTDAVLMVVFTHCQSPFDQCRLHSAMQLARARLDESQVYSAGRTKKV
jgi:hypothetical protein